ncbi:MAG: SpoIVB peptidase, partial [Clostridia bacterium]|nr:SpoIVB peptidase [Clostridia bacterium]
KDNPARTAGLKQGDRILRVGDVEITCNEDFADALNAQGGNPIRLRYVRGNKEHETTVCPRKNDDGSWQIGVLVKDSTAGIGTLTYIVPITGEYGCLGHGISDPDTDTLFCVGKGDLFPAKITNLRKGECGAPGELQGSFGSSAYGNCLKNCEAGLFGKLDVTQFGERETMTVASKQEVREGTATIRCTVDGGGIQEYDIEIVRIYRAFGGPTKNMLLRVTDPDLLAKTGGIVQGMSGSPIVQNGKIVGAVTHVLINDPTSGYGIFIENMLKSAA